MGIGEWIGIAIAAFCALFAHRVGRKSGKSELQNEIKAKLVEIQQQAQHEADVIEAEANEQLKEIEDEASRIASADDNTVINEFNDAFSGE